MKYACANTQRAGHPFPLHLNAFCTSRGAEFRSDFWIAWRSRFWLAFGHGRPRPFLGPRVGSSGFCSYGLGFSRDLSQRRLARPRRVSNLARPLSDPAIRFLDRPTRPLLARFPNPLSSVCLTLFEHMPLVCARCGCACFSRAAPRRSWSISGARACALW